MAVLLALLGAAPVRADSRHEIQFSNRGEARARGIELAAALAVDPRLRLSGSWTAIGVDLNARTPHHLFQAHAAFELTSELELDLGLYYTGRRRIDSPRERWGARASRRARAWTRASGWRPVQQLELALVGQNLFDRRNLEFAFANDLLVELERSLYAQATWSF